MSSQRSRLSVLLLGAAIVVCVVLSSAAQPLLPPVEQEGDRPARAEVDRDPGYLGLIADDRAEQGAGVRVVRVVEGTPAADAGIAVDDLIIAIDGKPIDSVDAMAAQLQPHGAGEKVRFEVRRGEATRTIDVTLGRRPPPSERPFDFGRIPQPAARPEGLLPPADVAPPLAPPGPLASEPGGVQPPRRQLLGIRTGAVTEEVRQRLRLPGAVGARVVSRVVGSPADRAGIPLEAVIVAVDDQPVTSPVDLARLIAAAGPGKEVELTYIAGGERRKVTVRLADVASRPPLANEGPMADPRGIAGPPDGQRAQPASAAERVEELERRVRELEKRVQELEGALKASPEEQSDQGR